MRKGISLVALVITIIVLIILTAAVFLTGGNVPKNAELSVFLSDVGNVQDAVTLKIANNLAEKYSKADGEDKDNYSKFTGIVTENSTVVVANDATAKGEAGTINGVKVWKIDNTADLGLSIPAGELGKYAIDANGGVYYWNNGAGKLIDNVTYYRNALMVSGTVSDSTTSVSAVTSISSAE